MVAGGWDLAASVFGVPFGSLDRGAAADLAVLAYQPHTPVSTANVAGHFLFGLASRHVESAIVAGRWVLWNRTLPQIDEESVMARARDAAARLWKKLD
jgi:cytosine/adenosine deaminase-related metal-dependent hydrolase